MMEGYDSYKDSGIIWVGQTPQHWSDQKIKFLFKEKKSTPNLSLNCGSISFGRVVFKDDDSIPSSRKETYQEVLDGEFLINPLNLNYDLKSLRIARSDKNVVVSPGYMVLQLQRQSDPKFFEFLLHVFDTEHMKSLGSGVRQTISFNHLKTEQLPIPPIDEQRKIGQYLDRKTTLIDSLIEKTVRKIELLKEKRTSLINEVVTKGLNPDVEMKDSGVEWIGEIPSHWSLKRLSWVASTGSGTTPKSSNDSYYSGGTINWLITGDLNDDVVLDTSKKITPKALEECRLNTYPMGSIVVAMYGATIGKLCQLGVETTVNQACCVLSSFKGILPKQVFYRILSSRDYLLFLGDGGGQPNISQEDVRSLQIPIPPLLEQEQIVAYLDRKTTLIDSLIEKTVRKIELLKEKRTSLINEVVTKGLNPDVEMKDSGVEWIGEIPSHWEIRKGSTLGVFSKGNGIKKDEVTSEGIPCVRYGELYTIYDHKVTQTVSFVKDDIGVPIEYGTLLMTGSGELVEDIGKCVVYSGEGQIRVGGDLIILVPSVDFNPLFLSYLMNSESIRIQREMSGRGGIIVHIYSKNFKDMKFSTPPLQEQDQIVDFLDEQTSIIDSTITNEEKRIELLKEYRQSLISEVVTGKVKVTRDE